MNCRRKRGVNKYHVWSRDTYQWIPSLPTELLPQKLDHGLESVGCSDLVEVLSHYWRIADGLESYDDW